MSSDARPLKSRLRPRYSITVVCLFASYLLPFDFAIGGLQLNPTRLVLLFGFTVYGGALLAGRKTWTDWALLLHIGFVTASFAAVHGAGTAVEAGGIYAVEVLGGYAIARRCLRDARSVAGASQVLLLCVAGMLPFAFVEFITGYRPFSALFAGSMTISDMRMGFFRAHGPFRHAILFGCFCGSGIAMYVYSAMARKRPLLSPLNIPAFGVFGLGTFMGLTSGGLLMMNLQMILMLYDRFVEINQKFKKLLVASIIGYIVLDLLSNRPAYIAILTRLTFNAGNVYYRDLIFEHGMNNVWAHPLFGIGLNDWVRPFWMFSPSVDNFWLLVTMRHGIPCTLCLAATVVLAIVKKPLSDDRHTQLVLRGVRISLFAVAMAGATVHLWSFMLVHFVFLIGCAESLAAAKPAKYSDDDTTLDEQWSVAETFRNSRSSRPLRPTPRKSAGFPADDPPPTMDLEQSTG